MMGHKFVRRKKFPLTYLRLEVELKKCLGPYTGVIHTFQELNFHKLVVLVVLGHRSCMHLEYEKKHFLNISLFF